MIIPVNVKDNGYKVVIESGAISRLNNFFNLKRKILIVTDDGVPEKYGEIVLSQCDEPFLEILPHGEGSKTIESFKYLLSKMSKYGFTRGDAVVAVGGGVIGDLAGFVAASYMRGVDFYNVPTTFLAMVDSSIGGKVAVNLDGIKNIVGAFYQPKCVVVDVEVLKTLDKRQLSAGLIESVKMAATMDKELFEIIERDINRLDYEKIIEKSLLIKKAVVEKDPTEKGLRKVLNFGHTVGHAVESCFLTYLLHGECVGLGMLVMCSSAVRERIEKILKSLGAPTAVSVDKDRLLPYLVRDKKSTKEGVVAVYCEEIGSFEFREISYETAVESLDLIIKN